MTSDFHKWLAPNIYQSKNYIYENEKNNQSISVHVKDLLLCHKQHYKGTTLVLILKAF